MTCNLGTVHHPDWHQIYCGGPVRREGSPTNGLRLLVIWGPTNGLQPLVVLGSPTNR
jgi:hypothetical protein